MTVTIQLKTNAAEYRLKFLRMIAKVGLDLDAGVKRSAEEGRTQFEVTTRSWKHDPRFDVEFTSKGGGGYRVTVNPPFPYQFVNRGTRKNYPIPKSGTALLRFRAGYNAKTIPGIVGSRSGGPFGGWRFARKVIHPGIEARKFSKIVQDRQRARIQYWVRKAIGDGIRSSGFGG